MSGTQGVEAGSSNVFQRAPAPVRIVGPVLTGVLSGMLVGRAITSSLGMRRVVVGGGALAGVLASLGLNARPSPLPPLDVTEKEWQERQRDLEKALDASHEPYEACQPLWMSERLGDVLRAFSNREGFEKIGQVSDFAHFVQTAPYLDLRGLDWDRVGELAKRALMKATTAKTLTLDAAALPHVGDLVKDADAYCLIFEMNRDPEVIRRWLVKWSHEQQTSSLTWLVFLFSSKPDAGIEGPFMNSLKDFQELSHVVYHVGTQEGVCLGVEKLDPRDLRHWSSLTGGVTYDIQVRLSGQPPTQDQVYQRVDKWFSGVWDAYDILPCWSDGKVWSAEGATDPLVVEQQLGALLFAIAEPDRLNEVNLLELGLFRDAAQADLFLARAQPSLLCARVSARVATSERIEALIQQNPQLTELVIEDWDHLIQPAQSPFGQMALMAGRQLVGLTFELADQNRFTSGEVTDLSLVGLATLAKQCRELTLTLPRHMASATELQEIGEAIPHDAKLTLTWVDEQGKRTTSEVIHPFAHALKLGARPS